MFLNELNYPVDRIKGIGTETLKDLKNLGILDIKSLLKHYPIRWEDRLTSSPISSGKSTGFVNTLVKVIEHSYIGFGSKKTLKVLVQDKTGYLSLICFGRNFLEKKLPIGEYFYIYGSNIQYKFSELQCSSFEFEKYIPDTEPKQFNKLLPIYKLSGKLTQHNLRKFIYSSLVLYGEHVTTELPRSILDKYNLIDKNRALEYIHFPMDHKILSIAKKTLIYEELFHLQLITGKKVINRDVKPKTKKQLSTKLQERLINKLPFDLTKDQKAAIEDIIRDLNSTKRMNRLVQGDVGSGKTLVALLSAIPIIESGGQVALMAPTELLAKQHSEKAYELLHSVGIRTAFISGNIKSSSRKILLTELEQGNIDLIIGTHALFTQDVIYKKLDLIIVDEQHRFGVKQRMSLKDKGDNPDILLMTATPIPRTLTLTLFGDLDVSTIKTMPVGRKPIETHLSRIGNEEKVYDFIFKELIKGRQVYFVYPLIEQSEKMNLKDAQSMYENLQKIFSSYKVALIHSKVSEEDKENSMNDFNSGKIDILVATSVVEVGVDVPNATVMVIEHAERFGLSALHQLRGRVGRGNHQSYCFLIYSNLLTDDGKKRLMTMKNTNDGFIISQEDLKLRGPGDIAGIKQSGFMQFSIANLVRDIDIIELAREDAFKLLKDDPGLLSQENSSLRELYSVAPPFSSNFITLG
ncbi:ATP-dependent DNA helicase RecG [Thiospirochaeta perfilievii]|uniref:ATP-dependent DNA helicase RecG n=1 Tax=Thiospirochaeta perfilievii TaxID=252967 RepID=A0A5C1QDA2_9SPIO|nr:ATP-dependent DNA helicase RecG [Thiospirochaeta perfilievii]QEN06093.1 ATP-dependent DNA helicase RecG [Thiospirochaeta perfilievii]